MGKTAWMYKASQPPKYKTRAHSRCQLCGRARGYYRKFRICRLCFRKLASKGEIPGVRKASW